MLLYAFGILSIQYQARAPGSHLILSLLRCAFARSKYLHKYKSRLRIFRVDTVASIVLLLLLLLTVDVRICVYQTQMIPISRRVHKICATSNRVRTFFGGKFNWPCVVACVRGYVFNSFHHPHAENKGIGKNCDCVRVFAAPTWSC